MPYLYSGSPFSNREVCGLQSFKRMIVTFNGVPCGVKSRGCDVLLSAVDPFANTAARIERKRMMICSR